MLTLITGVKGFTGRYLQDRLSAFGHQVVGFDCDLTDASAVAIEVQRIQPDWVVHLAGISFVGHGEPNDFYRVNLIGTRNLLTALAGCTQKASCVLLASSANVYGNTTEGVLFEKSQANPSNDYAVSKLAMEYVAGLFRDQLPLIIVRPFNYTGVGQSNSFLLPKIVDHFRRRIPLIELGNLDVKRDFSDVRVVVEIYRRLLGAPEAVGRIFNVCSGCAYTLQEVLEMARDITGHDIQVMVNPAFVRPNEVKRLLGARAELESVIGPIGDISLRETLLWMLDSPVS